MLNVCCDYFSNLEIDNVQVIKLPHQSKDHLFFLVNLDVFMHKNSNKDDIYSKVSSSYNSSISDGSNMIVQRNSQIEQELKEFFSKLSNRHLTIMITLFFLVFVFFISTIQVLIFLKTTEIKNFQFKINDAITFTSSHLLFLSLSFYYFLHMVQQREGIFKNYYNATLFDQVKTKFNSSIKSFLYYLEQIGYIQEDILVQAPMSGVKEVNDIIENQQTEWQNKVQFKLPEQTYEFNYWSASLLYLNLSKMVMQDKISLFQD